jgi:hypothetical protein
MLLPPGDEFFSRKSNLINIELIAIEEFRQDIEELDFVLF